MTTDELSIGSLKSIECNTCKVETNHELKHAHSRQFYKLLNEGTPNEQLDYEVYYSYYLWTCRGCNTATIEVVADVNSGMFVDTEYHPRRMGTFRIKKRFMQLSSSLNVIYGEVVECFNAGLKLTCAMGLRALLEGICLDKGITDREARGLEGKLNKLNEGKHLPSN